ncbi:MAG: hypothetical protein CMH61_01905 [Nanoarchaeota archaeon]|nr:hypothetical protein [Nanoarchaeota archaeon]
MVDKKWVAAPLKKTFMLSAMLGFIVSAYWVYPASLNWGIAFMVVFAAMFVASLVSAEKGPVVE